MSTTDIDITTGEIIPAGMTPTLQFAFSPAQTRAWMDSLQEYRRALLIDGTDYAVIPGTDRPSLLKPGAEKLLLAGGFNFSSVKVDDEDSRSHTGVTYTCSVWRGDRANVVATCDGYAGYDESRFFASAADAEAKERAIAAKYQRPPKPEKFVEYRAPWNSVLKMAQKRALVGATLNALAASGLFTQDMEDTAASSPAGHQFDPMTQLGPWLARLSPDGLAELKRWRADQRMPAPSQMSAEQTAAALVEIGKLILIQTNAHEPADPTPTADAADPDGAPFTEPVPVPDLMAALEESLRPPATPTAEPEAPEYFDRFDAVLYADGPDAFMTATRDAPEAELIDALGARGVEPTMDDVETPGWLAGRLQTLVVAHAAVYAERYGAEPQPAADGPSGPDSEAQGSETGGKRRPARQPR